MSRGDKLSDMSLEELTRRRNWLRAEVAALEKYKRTLTDVQKSDLKEKRGQLKQITREFKSRFVQLPLI